MQEKIIEIRGTNDKWILVNCRDIKCITFDRLLNDREKFKITIMYYGDEGELEVTGAFTESECSVFKARVV